MLDGQRVVITGSSRGLGRAFAHACARNGAKLIVNGTNETALKETVESIRAAGGSVEALVGSVAEEAVVEALVNRCVERFGGIDAMVHNAGIVRDRTLLKMTTEEWDDVIAVHLRGAFLTTKYAALAMKENGGHIVQITSGSGLAGGFGQANYAAAKEGMLGLLRSAVLEFGRTNIRINALWPVADTDMTQVVFERAGAQATQEGRPPPTPAELGFGAPDEVAEGLVWLLSPGGGKMNGQCLSFNGRRTALWGHPQEQYLTFTDEPMSAQDLAAYYADKDLLPPARPKLTNGAK